MSSFKSFLLGIGVAYGVYYITRKDEAGRSLLDKLLERAKDSVDTANKAVDNGTAETVVKDAP